MSTSQSARRLPVLKRGGVSAARGAERPTTPPPKPPDAAMFLPKQGGNIVLLTQLYWPTVHPEMQEPKRGAS